MTVDRGRARLLIPLAYMAGLFLLSSIPDTDRPAGLLEGALLLLPPKWQNLLHVPLYGGLTACWIWALLGCERHPPRAVNFSVLVAMSWGVFDELYQTTVPGRFGSATDMGLNLIGVILAATIAYHIPAGGVNRPHQAGRRRGK